MRKEELEPCVMLLSTALSASLLCAVGVSGVAKCSSPECSLSVMLPAGQIHKRDLHVDAVPAF